MSHRLLPLAIAIAMLCVGCRSSPVDGPGATALTKVPGSQWLQKKGSENISI